MTTPHTPSEILRLARARIDTPEKWTQGEFALDCYRRPIEPLAPGAVCFCSEGALRSVRPDLGRMAARDFLGSAMGTGITVFNDEHSHAEVLAAFDRAIQLADQGRQGE